MKYGLQIVNFWCLATYTLPSQAGQSQCHKVPTNCPYVKQGQKINSSQLIWVICSRGEPLSTFQPLSKWLQSNGKKTKKDVKVACLWQLKHI